MGRDGFAAGREAEGEAAEGVEKAEREVVGGGVVVAAEMLTEVASELSAGVSAGVSAAGGGENAKTDAPMPAAVEDVAWGEAVT